ncbi:MAG: hypothetical protein NTY09_05510 [bacterium]|nr:hypothetical protein [bacterium]
MPINATYDLKSVLEFIKDQDTTGREKSGRDKITLEYVVLAGLNDTQDQIKRLSELLRPFARNVKLNLIPYNRVEGLDYKSPKIQGVFEIQEYLVGCGISTFIRKNRGREASAACGQLSGR